MKFILIFELLGEPTPGGGLMSKRRKSKPIKNQRAAVVSQPNLMRRQADA